MDKRIIFAVAGSGKTTHIINNLSGDKKSLIVTYTNNNLYNLRKKIIARFGGRWPENITVMTYFSFLYSFCYKPFLSDRYKAKGPFYEQNPNKYEKKTDICYYMTRSRYLYSNRLALFLEHNKVVDNVKERIKTFFDEFVIDEIQDIAGRDFNLLENLMTTDVNMLFVGDFYQHTFDTSRDGNANKTLFQEKAAYEARFVNKGFFLDNTTLINSLRCSKNVCDYIQNNLGITMASNRQETDNTSIEYITDAEQIHLILNEKSIIKLHYQNSVKAGVGHQNWGDSKGEDHHHDVCVLLNKTTADKRKANKLFELSSLTKNRLYVAITRARGNVYLIDEACIKKS